jgi:DNA-binding PadR family transcriptional regulator
MVRRGDVRTAILALLAEEPMHGYQIIQQLGERSGGIWRASAGSVYPTLQQLEDEGLVRGEERDGRNVYALTDGGNVAAARSAKDPAPWEMPGASEAADLRDLLSQLGAAASQVSQVGSSETLARARAVLVEARRSLYRLLAEDDRSDPATTTTGSATDPSVRGDR